MLGVAVHLSPASCEKQVGVSLARIKRSLVGFVLNQGNDHAVKIEEEQDEVETELSERFLHILLAIGTKPTTKRSLRTFLWTLSLRKISVASKRCVLSTILVPCQH